ncbi:carboxypeptidase-like regulatory domain-containing protein [Nannocystis radixulma]|uniref:Carboxypeptidase-like regulatory domain-containing protein n=1 Tax=Nannocystis radixulma TaxID=2995305 RepID=A0ABT5B394_9BACT|nr:carboxypeptidase-like regulatory domain-containing protein [Nannocystis radixulma]MDC0668589.1 carboxypeptidase-like regulatory domain-containing protein [Nannocystis radixulma]
MPSIDLRILVTAASCLLGCAYYPDPAGNQNLEYRQRSRSMPVMFDITVIHRHSEEPVAGAKVMLMRFDLGQSSGLVPPQPGRLTAAADASGRLRLRGLAPGDYGVCATDGSLRRGTGLHARAGQRVRIVLRLHTPAELDGCEELLGRVTPRH